MAAREMDGASAMTSFVGEMLAAIAERGRNFIVWPAGEQDSEHCIEDLSNALLSEKGEASSIAIASELFAAYDALSDDERLEYFLTLASDFGADAAEVKQFANQFINSPSDETASELHIMSEPRRQELFRRLNHAPNGTRQLVKMRQGLLGFLKSHPHLKSVDADFLHLFSSWFNRGFLVLQPITWATPATILEKIIEYEAVHEIGSWAELRRRLQPPDRQCYAFFHPALMDDPLIFVEVALTKDIPKSVENVLSSDRSIINRSHVNTAVFYSISNCQKGLKNVSFGSFLIKQVVHELARELPQVKTFVTLSPIPGFAGWLTRQVLNKDDEKFGLSETIKQQLTNLLDGKRSDFDGLSHEQEELLMYLAADYFLNAKDPTGKPVDPVARFHLGNGARLNRINWAADMSEKGLHQSAGMMVNYLYEPSEIEKNHQLYESEKHIVASSLIHQLLKKRPTLLEATT